MEIDSLSWWREVKKLFDSISIVKCVGYRGAGRLDEGLMRPYHERVTYIPKPKPWTILGMRNQMLL